MSDDEVDPELLELFRQRFGISGAPTDEISSNTNVLRDAEHVYNNSIDVFIDMYSTKAAAVSVYRNMEDRGYSTKTWSQHDLHPSVNEDFTETDLVNFVFTMDLLNFSFWSELSEQERFQVEYQGKRWTGYKSLVACLRRALDDGIPITTPRFWRSRWCSDELLSRVFRSATEEPMPLFEERVAMLRETSTILHEEFDDSTDDEDDEGNDNVKDGQNASRVGNVGVTSITDPANTGSGEEEPPGSQQQAHDSGEADTELHSQSERSSVDKIVDVEEEIPKTMGLDMSVVRLIERASHSAGKLVNLLAKHFPGFNDETRFEGKHVRFLKRAQIFVADLWAALGGTGCGDFDDIDHLTMFADYRVPQMLHSLGVLRYSPPLEYHVSASRRLEPGHSWEVQLRGCSIWAVELMRREIRKAHPDSSVNAVLIDFFLYDLAKEREGSGQSDSVHVSG